MKKAIITLIILTSIVLTLFPIVNLTIAQSTPTIALSPAQITATQIGQLIQVNITISNVQNLWAWDMAVNWNPAVLNLTGSPKEGSFLQQEGGTIFIPLLVNVSLGSISDMSDTLLVNNGASGSGVLAMLQFQVLAQFTTTTISMVNLILDAPLPADAETGTPNPTITPTSTSATTGVTFMAGLPAPNAGQDQTVIQGATVAFNGSASKSSGTNPTYTWAFTDDGTPQTLTGINPTYTFKTPGTYTVTLTLTDSNGSNNSTVTITVQSTSKPIAKMTITGITGTTANVGQPLTFDGSSSYEPNNGTIEGYLWDMGDGNVEMNATFTYNYSSSVILSTEKSTKLNVTLTVFDATNLNDTTSTILTILPSGTTSPSSSPDSSTIPTPTPTTTSADDSQTTSNPTQTSPIYQQAASVPSSVLAILVIITLLVLLGSTFWLRKRT